MRGWIRVGIAISAVTVSLSVLATLSQPYFSDRSFGHELDSWFLSVGAGFEQFFQTENANDLVTAPLAPNFPDQYSIPNSNQPNSFFSFTIGHQWVPVPDKRVNIFLEYDHYGDLTINGGRFAFGLNNPFSSAYSLSQYSYNLSRQSLLFGAKVDFANWHQILPYVEAAFGFSDNNFYGYSNPVSAASGITVPTNRFPNNEFYDWSYAFGLGLDFLMKNNWSLSMGYRFGSYGEMKSGNITETPDGTALPRSIHLSNRLYSNQGTIKLSYAFSG